LTDDAAQRPLFIFVTDRNRENSTDWKKAFGSKLLANWTLTCGNVQTFDDLTREVGALYKPEKLALDQSQLVTGLEVCANSISSALSAAHSSHALVLIHGFNNTLPDVLGRAASLVQDINYRGPVIVWSWPSQGVISGYEDDERAAVWTSSHFVDFFAALSAKAPQVKLDFLAHSMGSRILLYLLFSTHNNVV
jgi:esterase/lipase superfamily enzyme